MATVTPTTIGRGINQPSLVWAGMVTGDTIEAAEMFNRGLDLETATVQMSGTWGAATVTLTGSLDGVTYIVMDDKLGTPLSATADSLFEVSSGVLYLKPTITGGTGDSVTVIVTSRGSR